MSAASFDQRPAVVTLFCVVLGITSAVGFGNAVAWNMHPLQVAASRYGLSAGGWIYTSIDLLCAAASLVSCVGLWRGARWARPAFLAWCSATVLYTVWVVFHVSAFAATLSRIMFVAGTIAVLGFMYQVLAQSLRWASRSNNRWRGP
jgi:hypothetical protein